MWQKIQAISSFMSAIAIAISAIIAAYTISDVWSVSRAESALTYCGLYLSNEKINEMASDTFNFSRKIKEEYPGVFDKKGYDEIIQRRKEINIDLEQDGEFLRSLHQLANYFDSAIDGVKSDVFDEDIIRDCLSTQIVCFREKYDVRLGLLDDQEMMDKWRKFIVDADTNAHELCYYATEEVW